VAIDAHPRPDESLLIEVTAIPSRLTEIRQQLATWLEPMGMSHTGIADIVLVVNEAATNCIEHAYRGADPGLIRVEAKQQGSKIVVGITDFGVWQAPPTKPSTRGRGLPIMKAVSDGIDMTTSSDGTTVRLTFNADRQG
jgi:anti-sigma regulatory factor (Ser/Thr protein kinase)